MKFIPARSPHFAGLVEAAVKSCKFHIKRVMSGNLLNFEEMLTLLNQIEACLNSRPLTALSEDPEDFSVLTPGHFLVGRALNSLPEPNLSHLPVNRLSRWQHVQQLSQHFWSRWSLEYLSTLQQRNKWKYPQRQYQIGDLVLMKQNSLPPLVWKLGRIIQVHPGPDGVVRVVTVKGHNSQELRTQFGVASML